MKKLIAQKILLEYLDEPNLLATADFILKLRDCDSKNSVDHILGPVRLYNILN